MTGKPPEGLRYTMKNNNDMKAVLQELAEEAMITGGAVWTFGPDGLDEQLFPASPRSRYRR
jgi:hypothetical protein